MSTLKVDIQNNSGIADSDVYIGFWGAQLNAKINGSNMDSIENSKWYKLSDITSFVMSSTTSGRFYVAYNNPWYPVNGGIPNFSSPSSAAYHVRSDKFEITFDGSSYGVADLTAIDYWSIPMSLETLKSGTKVGSLSGVRSGYSIQDVYNGLSALSNPVQSGAAASAIINAFTAAGNPLSSGIVSALQSPASGVVTSGSNDFVRVIGPNSYPPFGNPSTNQIPGVPFTPYNTFIEYFQYLINTFGPGTVTKAPFKQLGNGKIAHIAGSYGGSTAGTGKPYEKQTYDLWASIDDSFNLTIAGSGSVVGSFSMEITEWDLLSPVATYGGNPNFSLNGGAAQSPQNNLYAWVLGDFFSGLNIGAIGSSVIVGKSVVGEMTSSQWFSTLPGSGDLFNKLWGGSVTNYWNQWAQTLNPMSDAYNFAYAERFSAPQLSVNPATVDTLSLILLDASVSV